MSPGFKGIFFSTEFIEELTFQQMRFITLKTKNRGDFR